MQLWLVILVCVLFFLQKYSKALLWDPAVISPVITDGYDYWASGTLLIWEEGERLPTPLVMFEVSVHTSQEVSCLLQISVD